MKCNGVAIQAARRSRPQSDRKRYRCFYSPLDREGFPVYNESGHLPFVDLVAHSNEEAHRKAFEAKRCPITAVERLEQAS